MMASEFAVVYRQASKDHVRPTKPFEHLIFEKEGLLITVCSEDGHFIDALEELRGTAYLLCEWPRGW